MSAIYRVRLMFEWGGGCVWGGNMMTNETFDLGPIEERLPLSDSIQHELVRMSTWHDTALDWAYPPDPSPWSNDEFIRFEAAALEMQQRLQIELGPEFEVVYETLGSAKT